MINIIFYNNLSQKNVINKNIIESLALTGTIKENSSILNPIIIIKHNNDIINKNYCYIDAFKRYYYITDIVYLNNSNIQISLAVDVLESFKEDILKSEQIIGRQENAFNLYLEDNNITFNSNKRIVIKQIGTQTPFKTEGNDYINNNNYFYCLQVSNLIGNEGT